MHYQRESTSSGGVGADPLILERIERLASENAVVIFSVSSCCMCHAVKRLFCGMGVNPTVYEIDHHHHHHHHYQSMMKNALMTLVLQTTGSSNNSSSAVPVPVVFIGGKLIGGMDRVMASHINGTLVPLLKNAGALWL